MAARSNASPVIVKRKKIVSGHQHHGGAWKVAYADFVTAMMAFFMLMWLLNATTEKQRKGLADYFSPTASIVRVSGGGDGVFGGDSVFTDMSLVQSGTGASAFDPGMKSARGGGDPASQLSQEDRAAFDEVDAALRAFSGESMVSEDLKRHVITKLSDEGLVIEIYSLPDAPLFEPGTDRPTRLLRDLAYMIADVTQIVVNPAAVGAHMPSYPIVLAENPIWDQTAQRAGLMRDLLLQGGYPPDRIRRVTAHADRSLVTKNPMALRNERIEVVLLRRGL